MENFAITLLSDNQIGALDQFTQLLIQHSAKLHMMESSVLGDCFGMHCLVICPWQHIGKFEQALKQFAALPNMHCHWQHSHETKLTQVLAYRAYVISTSDADATPLVISFFAQQNLAISELSSETYKARFSDIPMNSLQISVSIPADYSVSDLRERFILFCDSYNLDGIIEPEKN